MLHRFREHFGTAGLVIAVVALVAALAGTAFAAAKLNSTQKKEVKKIAQTEAKKFQGTGPVGPKGDPGAPGAAGPAGVKGDAGVAGTNGTSATTESFNGALHGCTEGGVVVKSASPEAIVCNGKKGTDGTTGFTETLPSGKTETGTWAVGTGGTGAASQYVPISIPIPLAEAPELIVVQMTEGPNAEPFVEEELEELQEEGAEHGCPGIKEGVPLAKPGKLCVYANELRALTPGGSGFTRTKLPPGSSQVFAGGGFIPAPGGSGKVAGAGPAGSALRMVCEQANCEGIGVWAVTAE